MRIEYVASAFINYLRMKTIYQKEHHDTFWPVIQNMIQRVEDEFKPNIGVSFLYNSFTEADIGPHTRDLGKTTYADSGGLQMVTTKAGFAAKDRMDEEKTKVFYNQAKYADYGFSFDEIPAVKINEGAFGIGGSVIVKDLCEPYGRLAGKNLLEQYEIYKETGTKCKAIPIIQGADTETTDLYCQGLFSGLPEGFEKSMRGVALGGINTSNIFAPAILMHSTMKVKNKNLQKLFKQGIHLLGVGSLSKILGILLMAENNLLDIDVLTIDSASISKSYHYGSIRMIEPNGRMKTYKTGKAFSKDVDKIYRSIYSYFKDDLKDIFPTYEDYMKNGIYDKDFMSKTNKERTEFEKCMWYTHIIAYALFDLRNIVKVINTVVYDKVPFDQVINLGPSDTRYMKHLEKCKTHEQLDAWIEQIQSSGLDNKPVVETEADAKALKMPGIDEWL